MLTDPAQRPGVWVLRGCLRFPGRGLARPSRYLCHRSRKINTHFAFLCKKPKCSSNFFQLARTGTGSPRLWDWRCFIFTGVQKQHAFSGNGAATFEV